MFFDALLQSFQGFQFRACKHWIVKSICSLSKGAYVKIPEGGADHQWCWEKIYKDVRKEFIIERKTKVRAKSHPWMTSKIRKEINQRYKRLQIALRTNDQNDCNTYKRKRNEVTSILRTAERNYWKSSLLKQSKVDPKTFGKLSEG